MRLLQVVPTYLPAVRHGGPIRAVHGLAKALVARGHEVVAVTTHLDGDGVLDVPLDRAVDLDGVAVRYFPVGRLRRFAFSAAMRRWLEAETRNFDVVHLHSIFLWPTLAGANAARRARRPWLVSPRGMLVPELFRRRGWLRKRLWLELAGRRTLEGASRIVATSEVERREAIRFGLRLPAVSLLPNGVEARAFGHAHEPPPGLDPSTLELFASGPTFLYLGRLSWKKGIDLLLAALALAPEGRLLIAGNDDERIGPQLDRLASELGVAARVRRCGFVDGAEKAWLLSSARALVLPSLSENFANVVLEAWSAGTPVVVTEGVGLAEEARASAAGLVVERSPEALAAALVRLAEDRALAGGMGSRGRELCSGKYSWPAVAEEAEKLYRAVLDEPLPAARESAR